MSRHIYEYLFSLCEGPETVNNSKLSLPRLWDLEKLRASTPYIGCGTLKSEARCESSYIPFFLYTKVLGIEETPSSSHVGSGTKKSEMRFVVLQLGLGGISSFGTSKNSERSLDARLKRHER